MESGKWKQLHLKGFPHPLPKTKGPREMFLEEEEPRDPEKGWLEIDYKKVPRPATIDRIIRRTFGTINILTGKDYIIRISRIKSSKEEIWGPLVVIQLCYENGVINETPPLVWDDILRETRLLKKGGKNRFINWLRRKAQELFI